MDFSIVDVEPISYVYQEKTTSMDPQAIGAAMAEGFGVVYGFLLENGLPTDGQVMAVYLDVPTDTMTFRTAKTVPLAQAKTAAGPVSSDLIPAGRALFFVHVGPYATLRDSYEKAMAHMQAQGLTLGAPTWEVYVDDPMVTPEDTLRTEVYLTLR